jgi:hypothetical protein
MSNTGCCGIDCDACEVRIATVRNDIKKLALIAARLESEGHCSFIIPSRVRCTGCLKDGAKSICCNECRIRICAMENKIPNCGFCEEFPCDLGSVVWEAVPEYKKNLERIRSR